MFANSAQWIFVVSVPFAYALVASLVMWKNLERPLLFAALAVAALYAFYVGLWFVLSDNNQGYFLASADSPTADASPVATEEIMNDGGGLKYLVIKMFAAQMFIFSVTAMPLLWLLTQLCRSWWKVRNA